MMKRMVAGLVFGVAVCCVGAGAQAKRPMTFEDLMAMKRVSDPQVSPGGKWVMFSVTEVDLEKNLKTNHLWVVPLAGASDGAAKHVAAERQLTFWREGESGGRFSPDGKQVLFVSASGAAGLSQIWLAAWDEAKGTLGTPRQLTHVSTEADGAVWSPDSRRILFASRVYPECSGEDSWLHEDTCNKAKDEAAEKSPVKAQVWDHLLYRHWNSYVGPKRSHVLVVDAADGNVVRDLTPRRAIGDAEAPTFSLGGPLGYAWAPDGKEIAYVTNLDTVPAVSTNNDVFTLRLDEAGARAVKVSTSLGSDDGPAYSPDGKWLAFRSQARAGYEGDRFRLMVFDRYAHQTSEPLSKFDGWIDEFIWTDNRSICFTSSRAGEEDVFSADLRNGTLKLVGKGGEFVSLTSLPVRRPDQPLIAVEPGMVASMMRLDLPSEVVSLSRGDVDLGHREDDDGKSLNRLGVRFEYAQSMGRLTHINDASLGRVDLSHLESYWFTGAEGAKVQGFIVRPPNFDPKKKYPVKFLIHGGPQGAWGDAWSYRWNAELMAAGGYVVVMVNPRGSTGYGQAFIDGVNGDWGGKAYVDLMRGLDAAEAQFPFIDKTRECALGASYGGFMANWILTHTNRFACIVTHDGMYNPEAAYGDTEELWFNEWEFRRPAVAAPVGKARAGKSVAADGPGQPWRYAAGPVGEDPFRKWSPMLSIQNAKTPTLVIHSQKDYRLDVSEGMQLFTALQRLGVPSRMLYFPDEGHWVMKPQNSRLWYEQVGEWCDKWTHTGKYAAP